MRHLLTILAALFLCAASAQSQTLKSLMFNTNGVVVYNNTNALTFTNVPTFQTITIIALSGDGASLLYTDDNGQLQKVVGTGTNLQAGMRDQLGLGATNDVVFQSVQAGTNDPFVTFDNLGITIESTNANTGAAGIAFIGAGANRMAANTRTNLGLGATNIVTFAGVTNNGDITINQTAATNGLLFVYRTNNEPFLGIANLIASNNTTLSNETLFRVGRAEATNQSAQFGFRVVRTNNGGEGFATFSVFGYNALMMIGPSDRSRTNTATNAGIEADIYTITGSNRVMTLRDTNTGALTMHQDLGFGAGLTNNAPTNTTTPAVWLRVWVGTNNYRLPLYQ